MADYKYKEDDRLVFFHDEYSVHNRDTRPFLVNRSSGVNGRVFEKLGLNGLSFFRKHGIKCEYGGFPFIDRDQFDEAIDLLKEEYNNFQTKESDLLKEGQEVTVAGIKMIVRNSTGNRDSFWLDDRLRVSNREPFKKVGIEDAQKWCIEHGYISKQNRGDWPFMTSLNLEKCIIKLNEMYYKQMTHLTLEDTIRPISMDVCEALRQGIIDTTMTVTRSPVTISKLGEPEEITLPKHNKKSFKINL